MQPGSAPQADSSVFRSGLPDQYQHSSGLAYPTPAAVRFNDVPEYTNVPIRGYGKCELTKIGDNPRYYEKEFPIGYKPPKCHQSLRDAQATAKMLRATVVTVMTLGWFVTNREFRFRV